MSHAVLYIAASLREASLPESVTTAGIDVEHDIVPAFGIGEARSLFDRVHRRPVAAPYRSFVLCFQTITVEAQNALLKLLEEPPVKSRFFIVVPHESILLPTVRSRLSLVSTVTTRAVATDFSEFLAASLADRLAQVAARTKAKDLVWIDAIKQGALVWITKRTAPAAVRQQVLEIVSLVNTRGASNKMLLESLAIMLPVEQ